VFAQLATAPVALLSRLHCDFQGRSTVTSSSNAHGPSATTLASLSTTENRPWTVKLLAAAAVGICVGAILGSLLFRMLGSDVVATAFVRLNQPADLVALAGGASQTTPNTQENLQSYAAGEVAYLSDEGFAQAVGERLGMSEPPQLDVMQGGDTTVVTISSNAASESDAIRAVSTALDLYRQQIAQRSDAQLRAILPVLDEWERTATPDRVPDIQALRNRVQLQASPATTFTLLQPPTVNATTAQRGVLGALLGGLLGGALLPLLVLGHRRRLGRLASDPEVAAAIDGVLAPVVALRQQGEHSWGDEETTVARTLWAQLPTSDPARTIVVIGASAASGTAYVTSLLSFAAAENGPATTITLSGVDSHVLDRPGDSGALIIDAGAIGDSAQVPRAVRMADVLVLVARFGVDAVTQVLAVRAATAPSDAPLVAVFTHGSLRSRRLAGRGRSAPRAGSEA
jgi:hypothetical protein